MKALLVLVGLVCAQDAAPAPQTREDIIRRDIENAVQRLGSDRYTESYAACEELADLGRHAVSAIVAELGKPGVSPAVRRALCEILGRVRDPQKDVVESLAARLKDSEEAGTSVAAASARALASIADDSAVPALLEALRSKAAESDLFLKYECIRALGILRAREAAEPLIGALADKKEAAVGENDEYARLISAAAAEALGLMRASEAVENLEGALSEDAAVDRASGQSLALHAARALQRILEGELQGKAVKDDARAGNLSGEAGQVAKTLEAWKKWAADRKAAKCVEETGKKMAEVVDAIGRFKADQERLPAKLEELAAKPADAKKWPDKGYLPAAPKDGFGHEFLYRVPGTEGEPFDVIGLGADNREGGDGTAEDLWNHDKRPVPAPAPKEPEPVKESGK